MYKIAICDDDLNYIKYLEEIILMAGLSRDEIQFIECNSGEELFKQMNKIHNIDMVILDIQLHKENGNNIAVELREFNSDVILIFCSGIYQPTPETLKVSPYRFLLKQYSKETMKKEVEEIVSYLKRKQTIPKLLCFKEYDDYLISANDIMYVSIGKRGCIVHMHEGVVRNNNYDVIKEMNCKQKLKVVYEQLQDSDFIYVHNSYIVNMKYVVGRAKDTITLSNKEVLTVSRSRAKEVKEKLAMYLGRKYEEK